MEIKNENSEKEKRELGDIIEELYKELTSDTRNSQMQGQAAIV